MIIECMDLWACAYMHSHWIIVITGVWSKNVCVCVFRCWCLCACAGVYGGGTHTEFGRRSESSASLNFFFSVCVCAHLHMQIDIDVSVLWSKVARIKCCASLSEQLVCVRVCTYECVCVRVCVFTWLPAAWFCLLCLLSIQLIYQSVRHPFPHSHWSK